MLMEPRVESAPKTHGVKVAKEQLIPPQQNQRIIFIRRGNSVGWKTTKRLSYLHIFWDPATFSFLNGVPI